MRDEPETNQAVSPYSRPIAATARLFIIQYYYVLVNIRDCAPAVVNKETHNPSEPLV